MLEQSIWCISVPCYVNCLRCKVTLIVCKIYVLAPCLLSKVCFWKVHVSKAKPKGILFLDWLMKQILWKLFCGRVHAWHHKGSDANRELQKWSNGRGYNCHGTEGGAEGSGVFPQQWTNSQVGAGMGMCTRVPIPNNGLIPRLMLGWESDHTDNSVQIHRWVLRWFTHIHNSGQMHTLVLELEGGHTTCTLPQQWTMPQVNTVIGRCAHLHKAPNLVHRDYSKHTHARTHARMHAHGRLHTRAFYLRSK